MKKSIFYIAAVALALASCNEEELVNVNIPQGNKTLTASFEQDPSTTRMDIATSGNALTWSVGDEIAVISNDGYQNCYILSSGEGTANGVFTLNIDEDESEIEGVKAVFPYADVKDDGTIRLSSTLEYSSESGTTRNCTLPMLGAIENGNIAFKHLAGVLKVNLSNIPAGYNTLTVTASNPISGDFTITTTDGVSVLTSESAEDTDKQVTVTFTETANDVFYFPLPVGEYASIIVSVSNGTEAITLKNWTGKTVKRAKVYATSASTVWDGKTVRKVADTDEAGSRVLYEVSHAEELAWVLRNWNGGSTSPTRPTTISLVNDIDFGGHEIYFDMTEVGGFHSITLEGNNHTIKNYKVAGVNKRAGLFPQTSGITIKNLIIDNAVVGSDQTSTDLYAGALIGIATDQAPTPYTTVIDNVTVQNSSISGVNKVGGLIGQANGIHTVSNTEVKNTTITGCGTDAGSLGGLYGYLKVEGESSFINSKMTGGSIVCVDGEDKASRGSSGFIGTLGMSMANSSLTLTNCSVSETDLTKSNTKEPMNEFIGTIRSGTAATLTIDGENIVYFIKVWDGTTLKQVADTDEAGGRVLYEVSHAEELAWVLRNWNGGSTSATRPTTIKLLNDIDFGSHDIYLGLEGTSISFHCVTLDGNNHTIKNYKVAGVSTGGSGLKAGLLPSTSGVTVKDLTIDNAIIGSNQTSQDLYAGALIGIATDQAPTPYTTVIDNVTVQNSSISGVNKVGGLIGQANGIHTVSNTEVKNTTITGCGTDAGSLGGLYGYLKVEGESSFINSKMTGGSIVCEEGEDKTSRGSSGFIGTLGMSMANSSLTLIYCSVSETDLTKSNTEKPMNKFIGAIRSGKNATLTIDDISIDYANN